MGEIRRVGFMGLGNMGAPMAANLVKAGYELTAYDIAPARAREFATSHSAQATQGLAELGA